MNNIPVAKSDTVAMLRGMKKLKTDVMYRFGTNTEKICQTCEFYQKPSEPESPCSKVVGIVESAAVCDLWKENPDALKQGTMADLSQGITIQIKVN